MDDYGGPVWHASGRGKKLSASKAIARDALRDVGDRTLGEWSALGLAAGIVHVQRRMSRDEIRWFGVPEPIDIRGTDEEARRIAVVLAEAPHLRAHPAFAAFA